MQPLLMITHNPFWRADRGSRQRIGSLVRALTDGGWSVHVAFDGLPREAESRIRSKTGVASVAATGVEPVPEGARTARGWSLDAYRSPSMPRLVHDVARIVGANAVMCQQIRHAYLLDHLPPSMATLRICDTHDVMHERCRQFAAYGHEHWVDISREEEAAVLSRFDLLVAIHEDDARAFRAMMDVPVVAAPHTPALDDVAPPPADADAATVGFIGCAGHANRDAVERLVGHIWPRAQELDPSLRLVIAGDAGERGRSAGGPGSVTRIGAVRDLREFYGRVGIAVNPVRFGGGLKIKNVEALHHGRPLVTTPAGVYGMRDVGEHGAVVCDGDDAFAGAVVQLAADEGRRRELGRLGRAYVRERFNPESAYEKLLGAMGAHRGVAA